MSRIHLFGDDPEKAVARVRSLAEDLASIAAGEAPTAADLAAAPLLDNWTLASMPQPVLVGSFAGHPRLGDRPLIHTSVVFALDGEHGMYARTLSRFYRLGRRRSLGDGRDQ